MAKKINISAQQLAERWSQGLRQSSQKIEQGVNGVTEAPGKAAAAQAELWLANIQKSKTKWANKVAAVSLEDWKTSMISKGIPNLNNSLELGQRKVMKSAERLIPALNELMSSMPARGATIDQNLQRVSHIAKGLQQRFARG